MVHYSWPADSDDLKRSQALGAEEAICMMARPVTSMARRQAPRMVDRAYRRAPLGGGIRQCSMLIRQGSPSSTSQHCHVILSRPHPYNTPLNAPSKPYASLLGVTIPIKGSSNHDSEVGPQVLNTIRNAIRYYSVPRLPADADIICNIYELPLPYDREYFARHETVGELQQFADAIDDTYLKSHASLLSEEDAFQDARNALIIVYEVASSDQEREAIVRVAQKHLAASEEAEPATLPLAQDHISPSPDVVYSGRAPFVGIYHPVFAKFIRTITIPPEQLDFTPQELEWAHSLVSYSKAPFCQDRDVCRDHIYPILQDAIVDSLRPNTMAAMQNDITATGVMPIRLCEDSFGACPFIMDLQDERMEHDSDPAARTMTFHYVAIHASPENKKLRDISPCPALLLGIVGPRIIVSGAVYTDTLVVQDLTCYDTLGYLRHRQSPHRARRCGVQGSSGRPTAIVPSDPPSVTGPRNPEHPHFRQFSIGTTTVKLDYVERLAGANPWRAVFKARVVNFDPPPSSPAELAGLPPMNRYVAVKFAHRYCRDAHALLAQQSPPLAPALWYCADEPAVEMYVVVMEYVDGSTHPELRAPYPGTGAETPQWTGALRTAVTTLHEHGFVFGRLRGQNVFVPRGHPDEVRLVNFNWAGRAGEARYPSTISMGVPRLCPSWHPGVRRGGLIEKEHDDYLLDKIVSSVEQLGGAEH
ncbi:hypothetical protein LXA43DRAFT_1176622 [Ganoderma leucocontextum]|nr:hypothetical protein LXA43DRAFT_1176622 [Ganoderma leucocontextum]